METVFFYNRVTGENFSKIENDDGTESLEYYGEHGYTMSFESLMNNPNFGIQ